MHDAAFSADYRHRFKMPGKQLFTQEQEFQLAGVSQLSVEQIASISTTRLWRLGAKLTFLSGRPRVDDEAAEPISRTEFLHDTRIGPR
ncbi:MAG: hypothetical protein ACJ8AW_16975 [Rhodopila sp.]